MSGDGKQACISDDDELALARLIDLLRQGPMAVITGAGLSTGSGIPAYRDRLGQWQHPRPVLHQDFLRIEAVRRRYWARSLIGWRLMGHAEPNGGHRALAALAERGAVSGVITQNVDGLHQKAGNHDVIELHGNIGRVLCLSCKQGYARAEVQGWLEAMNPDVGASMAHGVDAQATQAAPDGDAHVDQAWYAGFDVPACPACDGLLKPDVVFFGDNVPRERVAAAMQAVADAHGLLVVGSSLMVYSGFRFAEQAHQLGKPVIAINQGVTRADGLLSAKIGLDCAQALESVARALGGSAQAAAAGLA